MNMIQYEQHSVASPSVVQQVVNSLPELVKKAAAQLASAASAAEILDARDAASVAYDASKKAARIAKAKGAHDELIAKAHRTQADALEIEAMAKRRLADEYDAAQERGEVAKGRPKSVGDDNTFQATTTDIGLTRTEIHEARQIRDAEVAEPGIARRALDARLAQGLEPTKAALREAVIEVAKSGLRGGGGVTPANKNPHYKAPTKAGEAWTHLYGDCRSLAEWATDENISLALAGKAERIDDQSANVRAVIRAAAILNVIAEKINAN